MKHMICLAVLVGLCGGLMGCASASQENSQEPYYRKKIYLTEEDYLEDMGDVEAERREAKPRIESEYIFNVVPETQKNVYFFDERVRPIIPGIPTDREYKNTKRLWKKPRRYAPGEYYGEGGESSGGAAESSSAYEDESGSDYD